LQQQFLDKAMVAAMVTHDGSKHGVSWQKVSLEDDLFHGHGHGHRVMDDLLKYQSIIPGIPGDCYSVPIQSPNYMQ
jgi:hypothetical protein